MKPIAKAKFKDIYKNDTERAYAQHLALLRCAGAIKFWAYEAIRVRLGDSAFYGCDFAVVTAQDELEFHEVKGFWREAAKVRIRVASSLYPFRFIAVQKTKGGWITEEF